MTSFGYSLNPRYAIKECLSCGALYTGDFCCSKGNVEDKILVPKLPKNCARCGHPVKGPYCQGCTLLRKKLEEDLVTYFQDFQNTFESSDDSTTIVNAPREPFVFKQDHGVNPPHIDECCCECGDALNGIFCQQCTCKSCGKGAHIGYNCPPNVPIIFNPEPYNQTMNNEPPQTLLSFDPTCYSDKENSCQPTNEDYCHEQNSCYNFNSFGFDHCQPPQYTVKHPTFNAHNDLLSSRTTLMEQMTTLTSMCEMVCQIVQKKQEEKRIKDEQAANARYWKIPACCDDDDNYNFAITPILSTEEPDNSLSMGDKYLDTIPTTESDEVIKSSVEDLVPILSEFEGIPDTMCDVHLVNNPTPLEAKDHFEIVTKFNDDISSSDDDSLYNENIDFFYDDHIEEISSGSTTTHSDISLSEYDSFIFNLSNDQFPPIDRSDFTHEEFADELADIISLPEYDCFYFRNLLDSGELIFILNSGIRENLFSTTRLNLPVEDDYSPLLTYVVWIFLAYLTYPVIPPYLHSFRNEDTIFDPGITINHFYSFKLDLSHRCGTFKKFNTHRSHLNESPMEMLFSTCSPMDQ
nr:hypothetical protein [Tanacetum cinerariifolium]